MLLFPLLHRAWCGLRGHVLTLRPTATVIKHGQPTRYLRVCARCGTPVWRTNR